MGSVAVAQGAVGRRCRKVNDLLITGASYRMVLRALNGENKKLDKRDRVSIDSIRNHTARHFPVQNVAKATYREILERRAKENGVDFVNGIAIAITPMAFYERDVSAILTAIAGALDYADQRGLSQREVKPSNILLTDPADETETADLPDGHNEFRRSMSQARAGKMP